MKLILKILLTTSMLTSSIYATTLTGVGYGNTSSEAKKESLNDLSHTIQAEVKSSFTAITKVRGKEFEKSKERFISVSSDLPLLGVEFDELGSNKFIKSTFIKSTANLSSKTATKLYILQIQRLSENIKAATQKLQSTQDQTQRYTILKQQLQDLQSFNKHTVVAILLGLEDIPKPTITQSDIKIELQRIAQKSPSIDIATSLLCDAITYKNIYLSAIKPGGSQEVTQFAKLIKSSMQKKLHTVKKSSSADYFLKGSYEILDDSIFVTISLYDRNNIIIKTNTATLAPKGYSHTSYKPKTKDFDAALNSEFIKSGDLHVNIGFQGYARADGIDLYGKDKVNIVAKTNKPICYFLLGYVLNSDDTNKEKFSYLLPIGYGNSPFINFITGEDINKNITLAQGVPIEAPYGNETLQIFASTLRKDGTCPLRIPHTQEDKDGYDVVTGSPENVLAKTRALNLKKKKHTVEKAEANIRWTSFEK